MKNHSLAEMFFQESETVYKYMTIGTVVWIVPA